MKENSARVAVLMATYNGAAYLEQQLQSILDQTHEQIDLVISDDGSTDDTRAILRRWAECWPKGSLSMIEGPRRGFAENFRSLIIDPAIEADYFAFCDQDDIWEPEKLEKAVAWLRTGEQKRPKLFCSRTLNISEAGKVVSCSPLFGRTPSFLNALVQSIAGGNTMVFNRAARELLARASRNSSFVSHDWWAYLLVSGAGGEVLYCAHPLVRYRQHPANQVGANVSISARISRMRRMLRGQFWEWTNDNISGLEKNMDLLTKESMQALRLFRRARQGGPLRRLRHLRASGVYRQTRLSNLALYLAVMINRL